MNLREEKLQVYRQIKNEFPDFDTQSEEVQAQISLVAIADSKEELEEEYDKLRNMALKQAIQKNCCDQYFPTVEITPEIDGAIDELVKAYLSRDDELMGECKKKLVKMLLLANIQTEFPALILTDEINAQIEITTAQNADDANGPYKGEVQKLKLICVEQLLIQQLNIDTSDLGALIQVKKCAQMSVELDCAKDKLDAEEAKLNKMSVPLPKQFARILSATDDRIHGENKFDIKQFRKLTDSISSAKKAIAEQELEFEKVIQLLSEMKIETELAESKEENKEEVFQKTFTG